MENLRDQSQHYTTCIYLQKACVNHNHLLSFVSDYMYKSLHYGHWYVLTNRSVIFRMNLTC